MSQDIAFIRKELIGFKEVDSAFDLKIGKHVKYITIKDNEEFFYIGGKYNKMGDNNIFLDANPPSCILKIKDKLGNIIYSTRLFTEEDDLELCLKDKKEYEKIIQTQQLIIDKLSEKAKKNSDIINQIHENRIHRGYQCRWY